MHVTDGNKLTLFVLFLLTSVVINAISFLTCGVGVLVAQPFFLLMTSVEYLLMTGQPVAVGPAVCANARWVSDV